MQRIHFMQQWLTLSDPAMEDVFFDTALYHKFAQREESGRLPDESTILRFRHWLEKHKLAEQILVTVNELLIQRGLWLKDGTAAGATLIEALTSAKNKDKARDSEMHASKKDKQWYFGRKTHNGVNANSGLLHSVRGTADHVADVTQGNALLHGQEKVAFGDAGYQCIDAFPDTQSGVTLHIAMRPGKRKVLKKQDETDVQIDSKKKIRRASAPRSFIHFRGAKHQFGCGWVRYCGLKKNTAPPLHAVCTVQPGDSARQLLGERT